MANTWWALPRSSGPVAGGGHSLGLQTLAYRLAGVSGRGLCRLVVLGQCPIKETSYVQVLVLEKARAVLLETPRSPDDLDARNTRWQYLKLEYGH